MRDVTGVHLKEGDFVLIKLGVEWVPATIYKMDTGKIVTGENQPMMDKITVLFDINIPPLGQNYNPLIRRVPHPDHERIVSKGH